MIDIEDAEAAFRDALIERGLEPPRELIADGQIHRCGTTEKPTGRDGAYLLHLDGLPAGGVQNWADGRTWENWCSRLKGQVSAVEWAGHLARVETWRRKREAEVAERHAEAKDEAARIWGLAAPARSHPYLAKKRVQAHGTRVLEATDELLIPVLDLDGGLHGMQTIGLNDVKRFRPGTAVTGHFFPIGDLAAPPLICIGEGFATMASVYSAGHTSVVAFNCGNLLPVAKAIHGRYPNAHLIICADDDIHRESNPGLTHATETARAVGGSLAVPTFGEERPMDGTASDFNDLHQAQGLEAVSRCIDAAAPPVTVAPAAMIAPERTPGHDGGFAETREPAPCTTTAIRVIPPRLTPGERARALGTKGPPIPTGIPSVDRMTRGGFRAGKLIVVAGAPGAFKTALTMQWARVWALAGHLVAVIAADEAADDLLTRFGQGLGLGREALEDGDPEARADLAARLDALPGFSIFDADGIDEGSTVENVAGWLAEGANGKPPILIVDSLQTVRAAGTDDASDPRARIGAVVGALKASARLGILVVATCELARGAYRSRKTGDRTELLASLKESGVIEYAATVIIGLRSIRGENGVVKAEIAKNRLGPEKPTFGLAIDFERASLTEAAVPSEVAAAGRALEMNSAAQFTADMEAVRQALRVNPGIRGNDRLCSMLKVGKTRARSAVRALEQAGEVVNKGTPKRPLLYLADANPPESPPPARRVGAGDTGADPPDPPRPYMGAGSRAGSSGGWGGRASNEIGGAGENDCASDVLVAAGVRQ